MRATILIIFYLLNCGLNFGQVQFYDATQDVLGDEMLTSTICVGFNDLNGDLKDDLFLLDEGKRLKTFQQHRPGGAFTYKDHLTVSSVGEWAFLSGDLENDGIPEIIVSGANNGSKFLKMVGETYVTQFATKGVYSQNTNLVDVNNDGFLDFFVCNDDGESLFFINNGNGGMVESKIIDFKTSEEDDMSGNYSSIFTDIDGDGDLDLYIGKCKAQAVEPTDPRRINTLYINNGDGTYEEKGAEFGLDISAQSWSLDSGDIDNDGDTDILIANHYSPHDLMINDGNGHFDRKTLLPEGYSSLAFQSFFADFDNNGWLDIIFTNPSQTFILFNDEMSFTRRDLLQGMQNAFSAATGDLNSDGFPDLYFSFANSFQKPSSIPDMVLMNEGNDNNFVTFKLTGTISNRDAVGAKVILHQGESIKTREVIIGKSYGIMNSTLVHFGLGTSKSVDSVTVHWPSGATTVLNEVEEINTFYHIIEDSCITSKYHMPDLQLCDGQAVSVSLPDEFDTYQWSNGSNDQTILISEAGWYSAEMGKDGCVTRSSYFEVTDENEVLPEQVLPVPNQTICSGESIKLEAYSGIDYSWSTGEDSREIVVDASGIYTVTVTTNCGILVSEPVEITVGDVEYPNIENDTIKVGERAVFVGESESLHWYQNKHDEIPLAVGSEFESDSIFEDLAFFVGDPTIGFSKNTSLMTIVPLNNVGDSIFSENEYVEFDVKRKIGLRSFKVRTQKAGIRRIVIRSGNEEVSSFDVDLDVGVNTIEIDYLFDPGTYAIGTDPAVNNDNLGTEHPQLSYSTIYVENDKKIQDYLQIMDSQTYPEVSPYFFDWDIDYDYFDCEPRVPVYAVIKESVATEDRYLNFGIYPNPTTGRFIIESEEVGRYDLYVFNVHGQLVLAQPDIEGGKREIDITLNPGVYFVKLSSKNYTGVKKVYIIR